MTWQTAHKDHAIERVALSFNLVEQLPSRPWAVIQTKMAKLAATSGFLASARPDVIPESVQRGPKVFEFAIGPGGIIMGGDDVPQTFVKKADDGLFEQFSMSKLQLSYVATRYTGWSAFLDRSTEMLREALDEALGLVLLRSIKLEYWDRFVFDGDKPDYSALFSKESRHVPSFAFDASELWHAHTGYFLPAAADGRHLVNVNLDMLDVASNKPGEAGPPAETKRSAGVYSMVEDHISTPDKLVNLAATLPILKTMHAELKDICADIVTAGMAERIGLNRKA